MKTKITNVRLSSVQHNNTLRNKHNAVNKFALKNQHKWTK